MSEKIEQATEVIRQMVEEGVEPSVRTLRERGGFGTRVASDALRAWREAKADDAGQSTPEVPDAVVALASAVWAKAVELARAEHTAEVEGYRAQVERAETDRDDALAAAEEVEKTFAEFKERTEKAESRADRAERRATAAEEKTARQEKLKLKAEASAAKAEGIIEGLREALQAAQGAKA